MVVALQNMSFWIKLSVQFNIDHSENWTTWIICFKSYDLAIKLDERAK